jgi:hypothetical protein
VGKQQSESLSHASFSEEMQSPMGGSSVLKPVSSLPVVP